MELLTLKHFNTEAMVDEWQAAGSPESTVPSDTGETSAISCLDIVFFQICGRFWAGYAIPLYFLRNLTNA